MNSQNSQPGRIDGSIPVARPAFLSQTFPHLEPGPHLVSNRISDLGTVVIDLSDSLHLHLRSEEQARALLGAAARAIDMFIHSGDPKPVQRGQLPEDAPEPAGLNQLGHEVAQP